MASDGVSAGMKRQLDYGDAYDASKRQRGSQPESRVVFVRGLPADCLESELLALCCPFAVVEKNLLIPQKCQAFVQLPDVASAANLIAFYQSRDALIRGKKIFFEFSNRDEITTRSEYEREPPQQQQPRAQQAQQRQAPRTDHYQQQVARPDPYQQQAARTAPYQQQAARTAPYQQQAARTDPYQQQAPRTDPYQQPVPRAAPYQQQPSQRQQEHPIRGDAGRGGLMLQDGPRRGVGPPNQILMVSVAKIEYDVTVEVLQQVFQKFGNVQKIVTFWKNDEFKALVQMESVDQAQAAQSALDGRDIYTGCNQLSIVFSRHPELNVRFNNTHSRDYTNPSLPPGPSGPGDTFGDEEPTVDFNPRERRGVSPAPVGDGGYGQPPSGRNDLDYRGPSGAPDVGGGGPYRSDMHDSRRAPSRFDDGPPRGDRARDFRSGHELPPHSTGRAMRGDTRPSCALICSNLNRELTNPHHLFTLFGCFGDVIRIKIMFRKRDTALIQFFDEVHSTSALDHLDGVYIFGKKLRIDYSKHTSVSMPHADADRFELDNTLDFSGSPLHRYRRRSPQEAVSPCPLLHVSGIPMELQRNQNALVDLFAPFGLVKDFHFLQNNSKMALLEMGSQDEAVMALIHLDNLTYPDSHMRVSFSKAFQTPPGPGPAADAGMGGWDPPMQPRPRGRSRDRSRDRERAPQRGQRDRSFRDRGPPPQRGRDNARRPPPRY